MQICVYIYRFMYRCIHKCRDILYMYVCVYIYIYIYMYTCIHSVSRSAPAAPQGGRAKQIPTEYLSRRG